MNFLKRIATLFSFRKPTLSVEATTKPSIVFFLDPWYGVDAGTLRKSPNEKLIAHLWNLNFCLLLQHHAKARGVTTVLLRRDDRSVNVTDRLKIIDGYKADEKVIIGIRLWRNSYRNDDGYGNKMGFRVLYNECGNISHRSMTMGMLVVEHLKGVTTPYAGVEKLYNNYPLKMLRQPHPSILIEPGLIDNALDEQRLMKPIYQDWLAAAIVDAMLEYRLTINGTEVQVKRTA